MLANIKTSGETSYSKLIKATDEVLYKAFTNPKSLDAWLAPGDLVGKVNSFDPRIGGGYKKSLFYPYTKKKREVRPPEMRIDLL